jgi:DNA-binding transcriptional LysR family regulator
MRKEVGSVEWGFFARAGHPLQNNENIKSLAGYQLIGFSYIESDRVTQIANVHQLELNAQRFHGCENSRYSVQILKQTNAITCLPNISVQEELDNKTLVKLDVDIQHHQRPLVLSINKDYVSGSVARQITQVLRREDG